MGLSVYIIDYEQLRIIKKFTFSDKKPTSLFFVNGLQLILVGTSCGNILIYDLKKDNVELKLKITNCGDGVNQMIIDINCRKIYTQMSMDSCILFWSVNDGSIKSVNLTNWFKGFPFKTSKNGQF